MEKIDNIDARTLSQDAQEELRRQVIRFYIKDGNKTRTARQFGVSREIVARWWKAYQQGGWSALKKKKRGAPKGSQSKLNPAQESEIQKLIVDKTPDQLKMSFALWSREAVRDLIEHRYGIEYSLQAMSVILKRWGFTPQRPLKKAYEQRPAEVKQWLDESYPQIKERAKKENAQIWWADETALKPECHNRRGFAPKGKTPVARQPARRFHSAMISAVNNQGHIQWLPLQEAMNSELFIKFLKQLIKNRKRKIYLIVDNLKVHHSLKVKEWVEKNSGKIELFYLPAYSPDLNPDEYLNNDLKQSVQASLARTKDQLDAMLDAFMFKLSGLRNKVRKYFKHPKIQYALG